MQSNENINNVSALHDIHEHTLELMLKAMVAAVIFGIPVSSLRMFYTGIKTFYWIDLIAGLLLIVLWFFRHKLSFNFKVKAISASLFIFGIAGLLTFGFYSASIIWLLLFTCFIAATNLQAIRQAFILVFASITLIATLFTSKIITLPFEANSFITHAAVWVSSLFSVIVFSIFFAQLLMSYSKAIKAVTTELTEKNALLDQLANYDELTGLPLLRLSIDRLEMAIKLAQRAKHNVAVLYLDLDGFKMINDTLGHDAGDEILKVTSQRMQAMIRASDTACRIGGDEFLIILTNLADNSAVNNTCQRLINEVAAPIEYQQLQLQVTISIGVALYPEHALTAEALRKKADMAMYEVKSTSKNAYKFYQDKS